MKRPPEHTPAPAPASSAAAEGGAVRRLVRWGASAWIVFHFSAVLSAASSAGQASPLVIAIWGVCRPYLQCLYLNHGYNFFAPQPSPTTLLDFEVEHRDGSVTSGRLPELSMKPRLLYHRHLLLTEHILVAPQPFVDHWYNAYARHLCHKYKAARVSLTRLTHFAPPVEMFRNGTQLNDPVTFMKDPLGSFECGDF